MHFGLNELSGREFKVMNFGDFFFIKYFVEVAWLFIFLSSGKILLQKKKLQGEIICFDPNIQYCSYM
jgi:hypothetical protein